MNIPLRLHAAAILCAALSAAPGHAAPGDWLYFPMYQRDTSHAVHWSALKLRDDGLLHSASRYPGHSPETWTQEEWNAAWYEYSERLIDCETGFAIELNEQLLGADEKSIARREDTARTLADWKARLPERLGRHEWPDNSEYFLACASVNDRALAERRRALARRKPAAISYDPLYKDYVPDTQRISAKRTLSFDLAALKKRRPATGEAVFQGMLAQYRGWREGYQPGRPRAKAAAGSAAAVSAETLGWLNAKDVRVDRLVSLGDGTVSFRHRAPTMADLQSELPDRPERPADAEEAYLMVRADCDSGFQLPHELQWADAEGRVLVRVPIRAGLLLSGLEYRGYFSGEVEARTSRLGATGVSAAVCQALAAQCVGASPETLVEEAVAEVTGEDPAVPPAVRDATAPAQALLALREHLRAEEAKQVPRCRIGDGR